MKPTARVTALIIRARTSRGALWLLNLILRRKIPFNRPHGVRVSRVLDDAIEVFLPARRSNHNHLGGMHACALAAAAEFCTGILLLGSLDPTRYRMILERLQVDYHYRASGSVHSRCQLSSDDIQAQLLDPLNRDGVASIDLESLTCDSEGNAICTARVRWHIKEWARVDGAVPRNRSLEPADSCPGSG